jgi:transcription elongation factor Elf1
MAEQTCPRCGKLNIVAGLWTRGELTKEPVPILCGFCGARFAPASAAVIVPAYEAEAEGMCS